MAWLVWVLRGKATAAAAAAAADALTVNLMWFPQWLCVQDECLSCAQHNMLLFQSNPCLVSGLLGSNGEWECRAKKCFAVCFIYKLHGSRQARIRIYVWRNKNPKMVHNYWSWKNTCRNVRCRGHFMFPFQERSRIYFSSWKKLEKFFMSVPFFTQHFDDIQIKLLLLLLLLLLLNSLCDLQLLSDNV